MRIRAGLHTQLVGQHLAASFVLRQGGPSLASDRQQAHHRLVGFLAPRIQLHTAPGIRQRLLEFSALLIARHQTFQCLRRLAMQLLPLEQKPLLEGCTVGQAKALQEPAAVQRRRLLQPRKGRARASLAFQQLTEGDDIHPSLAGAVETDRLPRDGENRRLRFPIPYHLAHVRQRAPQVVAGGGFGHVGPQQPSHLFAPVWLLRLNRDVRK